MEHIINIAFDFDDDTVSRKAEKAVENELDKIIETLVLDHIAPMQSGWYGKQERNWNNFNYKVDDAIDKFLENHKEDIIKQAADKLVRSLSKTKVWKEKYGKVLDADEVGMISEGW